MLPINLAREVVSQRSGPALALGELVDERHRVDELLHDGATSTVFRGMDTISGRLVTIKVLNESTQSARFEREMQTVAQLRDPHTVRLYAHGTTTNGLVYMLEHIDGLTLAEAIHHHGHLEPDIVEHVLRQLLASLREAHAAFLLHRDVKPENILVFSHMGDPWCMKLIDFGIARPVAGGAPQLTAAGERLGTPRYMSPEQLLDLPLTAASDIYSAGLVAYEMLAGRDALGGNGWHEQSERLSTGFELDLAGIRAPARLLRVIGAMTARDGSRRLQSADAVLGALDNPDEPAATKPPPRQSTAAARPPRRTAQLTVLGVLVAVGAAIVWFAAKSSPAPEPPRVASINQRVLTPPPRVSTTDVALADLGHIENLDADHGCGLEPPFHGRSTLGYRDRQGTLSWLTYIPPNYSIETRHPLIVLIHQDHEPPETLLPVSGFEQLADEHGFIVIAPDDGTESVWRGEAAKAKLENAVQSTIATLCIDEARVFVVAHSQGGHLGEDMVCADWVAGVAINSYRSVNPAPGCPERATPFILLSPTQSNHVPFHGGPNCAARVRPSVAEAETHWRTRNGCRSQRSKSFVHGASSCFRWECDVPFESCHLDGGHGWPGAPARPLFGLCDGADPPSFPTAERIWHFFSSSTPKTRAKR